MEKTPIYYLNKDGEFVIDNYNLAKPFSSFLPGIAGMWGVPIWAFYVNRGQAIASFGIKDKDHPIMEFQPANKSYYLTPLVGFRTFIKLKTGKKSIFYDAFSTSPHSPGFDIENSMIISSDGLKLKEINHTLGLEVTIDYFSIPKDNYGALARKLTIKNRNKQKRILEILDGMPQIQPYGISNMFLKQMSRTIEAWMMVENHNNGIPFIRLKVEPADRPEVIHVKQGNFYVSFDNNGLVRPVVETEKIFGMQDIFFYPKAFIEAKKFIYPKKQHVKSKTPCAFAYTNISLKPKGEYMLYTIIGNMSSLDKLKSNSRRITDVAYFEKKHLESKNTIASLQRGAFTASSSKEFDCYCAQNFLDNIMRGGSPVSVEHASGQTNLHLYSRKHGDLERDYNMFLIEPTYFSQGNGNYRDVNQNRRCGIWFNPGIKYENVLNFFSFIQTDGYNPLVVKPDRFKFNQDFNCLSRFFNSFNMEKIKKFLKKDFTPGELFLFIEQNNITLRSGKGDLIRVIIKNSTKYAQAAHGKGFWIDHWHYCLDMLESYIGLYPEGLNNILFEREDFTFFDNTHTVQARSKKYILENNHVRQFNSVVKNCDKAALISRRKVFKNLSRTGNGSGNIYKTSLMVKMLVVISNKFANLDPFSVGIEMEADKPNWYDSLNGLPGLLGSSTCETFELKRWILFLKSSIRQLRFDTKYSISLPLEAYNLLMGLERACRQDFNDYAFWNKRHTLKENYRAKTLLGFKGDEKQIKIKGLEIVLNSFLKKIDIGLRKARNKKTGLYHSYFINEAIDYKLISKAKHSRHVRITKFKQRALPLFLEGMVHAFRVDKTPAVAAAYYNAVRESELFDKELKMYKVCASLESMPEEIGRARIFAPGWLENESVWLHMEYKYMLELLKSGLYRQFYKDFKNVFVPFLDPAKYGRSILENSSFIVSSVFSKKEQRGNGFVARLSGSTAEFVNIWLIMCAGKKPFYLDKNNKLCAELKPILPGWLFTKESREGFKKNTFSFRFLGKTLVVYHNSKRKNTFGKNSAKIKEIQVKPVKGESIILKTPYIPEPLSYQLRQGNIQRLDIILS
jgi:hypothetical protein